MDSLQVQQNRHKIPKESQFLFWLIKNYLNLKFLEKIRLFCKHLTFDQHIFTEAQHGNTDHIKIHIHSVIDESP